jgi:hypothetical protein
VIEAVRQAARRPVRIPLRPLQCQPPIVLRLGTANPLSADVAAGVVIGPRRLRRHRLAIEHVAETLVAANTLSGKHINDWWEACHPDH